MNHLVSIMCPILNSEEDESVFSNLCQYGLDSHYLDVLVADAARCTLRQAELFDAIITDRECALIRRTYQVFSLIP